MKPPRRALLAAALAAAPAAALARDAKADVEAALMAFLHAFENCDLAAMEAAFAADAVSFDRAFMSPKGAPDLKLDDFRRAPGMPAGMRRIAQELPKAGGKPPYQSLVPKDLLIQAGADMAVCTFHLEGPHSLARRTIALARRDGAWKIIHIHASNVTDAA